MKNIKKLKSFFKINFLILDNIDLCSVLENGVNEYSIVSHIFSQLMCSYIK